jgi:hypothetical protein
MVHQGFPEHRPQVLLVVALPKLVQGWAGKIFYE